MSMIYKKKKDVDFREYEFGKYSLHVNIVQLHVEIIEI